MPSAPVSRRPRCVSASALLPGASSLVLRRRHGSQPTHAASCSSRLSRPMPEAELTGASRCSPGSVVKRVQEVIWCQKHAAPISSANQEVAGAIVVGDRKQGCPACSRPGAAGQRGSRGHEGLASVAEVRLPPPQAPSVEWLAGQSLRRWAAGFAGPCYGSRGKDGNEFSR